MKKVSESYICEKNSKFYGFMYEIDGLEDIDLILNSLKNEHKKSKHIVYAYKLGVLEKKYEDKEPSNSAGKPILDIIHYKSLDNVLIVIVRYFGGTLLGKGLLTRTYSKCARELIK